jgi:DUF1680 family protein
MVLGGAVWHWHHQSTTVCLALTDIELHCAFTDRCNRMHEIWLPSAFHIDTFARSGVDKSKLIVMPQPVDTEQFKPTTSAATSNAQCFTFLSVFKWELRKV